MEQFDYLIIGAGPTGLGASYRLKEQGISRFAVFEANDHAGGLSASFKDSAGFTWDIGGHVLFSGNEFFLRFVKELMGDDLLTHQRHARVLVHDRWVDYPFQDHLYQLPADLADTCIKGYQSAPGPSSDTKNFEDWIHRCFGEGVARLFMMPYNQKVWAYPLNLMGFQWIKERVSLTAKQVKSGHNENGDQRWGQNNVFYYPRAGGIGAIFQKLTDLLKDHIRLGQNVIEVDSKSRTATTSCGKKVGYKFLLNTAPLDRFIHEILRPVPTAVYDAAKLLKHNSVNVIGVGLDLPGDRQSSWMYFPGNDVPFYRLTHLHNYAPSNTPKAQRQSSLMAEISHSEHRPVDQVSLDIRNLAGLVKTGILTENDQEKIVSTWRMTAEYGYPVPSLKRDDALSVIQPFLEELGISSRGRFGGWVYEVGNMDHSFMQGAEWVDRIVLGTPERTYPAGFDPE